VDRVLQRNLDKNPLGTFLLRTCGEVGRPGERVVTGIGVVEPEVVLSPRQRLREFDHVSYVLRGDGGVGGWVSERGVVVQPVDHPFLAQIPRNVDGEFRPSPNLQPKRHTAP
jgi:hypothetical protein